MGHIDPLKWFTLAVIVGMVWNVGGVLFSRQEDKPKYWQNFLIACGLSIVVMLAIILKRILTN